MILSLQRNNLFHNPVSGLWTPALISTELWLDALDASTITESGGLVSQWDDNSGNGKHATQADGTLQPLYQTGEIIFNGINNRLETSLTQLTTGAIFMLLFPISKGTSKNNVPIGATVSFNSGGLFSTIQVFATGLPANIIYYTTQLSTDNKFYNGTNVSPSTFQKSIYMHQFSDVTTNSLPYSIGSRTSVLNNENYNGSMYEVIILSSVPDALLRQKIEGYLAWKWGTVADLPADHPYKHSPPRV